MFAANFLVSDLVLVKRRRGERGPATTVGVRALSGNTGRPSPGRRGRRSSSGEWKPERIERVADGDDRRDGYASFAVAEDRSGAPLHLRTQRATISHSTRARPYFGRNRAPDETTASLVFTDRSIYRPLQKILWKVLAYRGDRGEGSSRSSPQTPVTRDARRPEQPGGRQRER